MRKLEKRDVEKRKKRKKNRWENGREKRRRVK